MTRIIDWLRYTRWTWIIALLLAIVLLVLWLNGHGPNNTSACCEVPAAKPAPTVGPVVSPLPQPPPPDRAATLAYHLTDGQWVIEGVVADQATKDRLLASARSVFGSVVDRLSIDVVTPLLACDKADLFGWLLRNPGIGIGCAGPEVTVTGVVPSDAERVSVIDWAIGQFGSGVIDKLIVVAPVSRAEDVQCSDRMTAMVTFASGSAVVDKEASTLLDAIAKCLAGGRYEVAGHTDNTGTAEVNDPLSQQRADSVRGYLVMQGVQADDLIAKGYGSRQPVADNGNEEGRARNRRIEFHRLP